MRAERNQTSKRGGREIKEKKRKEKKRKEKKRKEKKRGKP